MPSLLSFLPIPTLKMVAIASVAAAVIGFAGGWELKATFQKAAEAEELKVAIKERDDAVEKYNALIADQQRKTQEVSNAYQKKIADLRRGYDDALTSVLNRYAARPLAMPGVPDAAGGHHAAPRRAGISAEDAGFLIRLAHQADLQAQQLEACQAWIKGQGSVGSPSP